MQGIRVVFTCSRPILGVMARETIDPLATAQLVEPERRTIERFASRLRSVMRNDLQALWLFGSRARRTAHAESDVDLLVIADGGRDRYGRVVAEISEEAAIAEGESPFTYSIHVHDREWLRRRRAISSFFIQEVDREKIVIAGSELN